MRALAAVAASAWLAAPAGAHGFGQRYDLPLPLSFYLFGAAAAVVITFVIVGLLVRDTKGSHDQARIDLLASPLGRLIANGTVLAGLKAAALLIFLVAIAAGFVGDQNPYKNIAPTLVWVIGWVGVAYVSAFIGNLWILVDPWRTMFRSAERIARAVTGRGDFSLHLRYPAALGVWPAVILLLALAWVELIYPNPAVPRFLALLAVAYSVLTFTGMLLFGCETWLERGEVFTLVFGTFARFAPLDVRVRPRPQLSLRPFGVGLLDSGEVSNSLVAFVLLLLASVLYDGALTTPEWGNLESTLAAHISAFGDVKLMIVRTAGLIVFWLLFFGTYLAISAAMGAAAGGRSRPFMLARNFAFTLVPIAIGYHLAHYLTFLLIQGQYIIPLASDPFGFGWNLLGTASYRVDIGIVDARFAWYTAVTAILLGHMAAVYLAHVKAMAVLDTRAAALRSQLPLTALMVVYTFVSLSILAEPMAERRAPAQPLAVVHEISVPNDAVIPQLGSGRLQPVGADKMAKQKLTYRVLGSAFHDGTRMTAADLLYSYMFAYRWSGDDPARTDALVAAASAVMRERLLGVRVVGTDTASKSFRFGDFEYIRELLVVEVYTSVAPLDPEQDAVVAPPWGTVPWHLLVLMEEAATRGWAAFSEVEARRRGIEWLDLARSQSLNSRLAALVETFKREGYRPNELEPLVTAEDARKRWTALTAFYKEHGHFLVTNGPYRLKRWSEDSATVEAFRDLSYPLGVGSFDAYAVPRRGFITKIEQANGGIRIFGDIELLEKHMRSYDLVRRPLQSLSAEVIKRAAPECRYIVIDHEGRAALAGQAAIGTDARFYIDLRNALPPGRFTLMAELVVNGNAMNAEIRDFPIEISSRP
ncbi:MAG TPA: hypothetical protein VH678_00185 [Xanthobacteraceae bacterium]